MKEDETAYVPPALDTKDAELLRGLLQSARQVSNCQGQGRVAMAAMICDFMGLDEQTYQNVILRAITGSLMRVEVTTPNMIAI